MDMKLCDQILTEHSEDNKKKKLNSSKTILNLEYIKSPTLPKTRVSPTEHNKDLKKLSSQSLLKEIEEEMKSVNQSIGNGNTPVNVSPKSQKSQSKQDTVDVQ